MEHQHLPPAVGLGSLHEGRIELQEPAEAVFLNEPDDRLVVGRCGRIEPVRAVGIVGMCVVARGTTGMSEASATTSPSTPWTRPRASVTAPIAHVPTGCQ